MLMFQKRDKPEYAITWLKYEASLSIHIAGDISWGYGLSENNHQPSCHRVLGFTDRPQLGNAHVTEQRYTRHYNDSIQI